MTGGGVKRVADFVVEKAEQVAQLIRPDDDGEDDGS